MGQPDTAQCSLFISPGFRHFQVVFKKGIADSDGLKEQTLQMNI